VCVCARALVFNNVNGHAILREVVTAIVTLVSGQTLTVRVTMKKSRDGIVQVWHPGMPVRICKLFLLRHS
jgi:hypothetical protein